MEVEPQSLGDRTEDVQFLAEGHDENFLQK